MKCSAVVIGIVAGTLVSAASPGAVILNEVFINPPGSFDDTHEFIELLGPPGMKLDGYAVACMNGMLEKYYPLNSINTVRDDLQEIDEFFSLDGLSLGANGMLLLGIGPATNYIGRATDTAVRGNWGTPGQFVWNGFRDTPGKIQNDGSNTFMLIRNRPGATQATNPNAPASPNLRWGKDVTHDGHLIRPVENPPGSGMFFDQWGDGDLDSGQPNGVNGQPTVDMTGESTPSILDDLEIVDEVSYEHDRGWEYDNDERHVDLGSTTPGLPYRHVHALDDPQGINPDVLTRVDYRTSGPGWPPEPGGVGEMANGNNWQDTATEQWIRGESLSAAGPTFFYDNGANTNPDSIQPFFTNVPRWLSDGIAPDYSFTPNSYQITPGSVNPLAVPFIPGDTDRDGDCDAADIAKLAAVFGNDNWIFSNGHPSAPEGEGGDPATQTRPWDVDLTGDNGIEPSDLQWVLNFQGNTTGRIVGRTYSGTTVTPATSANVYLNPNAGTACTITTSVILPPGRTLSTLEVGDVVTVNVLGQVTGGANFTADQQNGIMQYVHDCTLTSGGVVKVTGVSASGAFSKTRASLEQPLGVSGDGGIRRINGHATSFTQGLGAASQMYTVTLEAVGQGSTTMQLARSSETKFVASTPRGLKIGRTASNGDPASATYPAGVTFTVIESVPPCCPGNADKITPGQVNFADITAVLSNFNIFYPGSTGPGDADCDGTVNFSDITNVLSNFLNLCQ